jgi:hypothetical protein
MKALYLPSGPKNLVELFPTVNFREVENYYLELLDSADEVVATTNLHNVTVCDDDDVRIHFLNALGTIDAVNFKLSAKEAEQKSDFWQAPICYPLDKSIHATNRHNVKSNDTWTAKTIDYGENEMDWLDELFRSPLAWIEWTGTEGQPDNYLPIVILDDKQQKFKEEDRYIYEVAISFRMSHETINIRN